MLAAFLGPFCLDFQKINKISDYVPPIYRDTKAGLILSVQLGSTLCMSYSNGEYAREYINGKIEQLTQTVCNSSISLGAIFISRKGKGVDGWYS